MADEDDIRELIKRLAAAQRQGFHVTPAHIRLVLTALRFYLAARMWLAKPHADRHEDAPRAPAEKPTGPPATIADLRRHGLVALTIICAGPNCWNSSRVTFDELAVDDATPVPEVPRGRNFRCQKCGCRRVRIMPDWTDHVANGKGLRAHHESSD